MEVRTLMSSELHVYSYIQDGGTR